MQHQHSLMAVIQWSMFVQSEKKNHKGNADTMKYFSWAANFYYSAVQTWGLSESHCDGDTCRRTSCVKQIQHAGSEWKKILKFCVCVFWAPQLITVSLCGFTLDLISPLDTQQEVQPLSDPETHLKISEIHEAADLEKSNSERTEMCSLITLSMSGCLNLKCGNKNRTQIGI